jgi:hypothetical protein
MRRKKQKPPICIGGSKNYALWTPPLHERTFPRSLPHKRGRCREAIGMGFAYHCVYLSFHFHMILEIRQYPKVTVTAIACILFVLRALVPAHEPDRDGDKLWWAGRESNPDLQLRTLPCCSVTLPTHLELAPGIQPGSLR